MAHRDDISSDLLNKVAGEIQNFTRQGGTSDVTMTASETSAQPTATLHVSETLTIWKFRPGSFEKLASGNLSEDLSNWLEPTGYLYHQIRLDDRPIGFARSTDANAEKAVSQLNVSASSERAARIHEALEMIEQSESDDVVVTNDPVVRLLEVPSAHIVALWLYAEALQKSRVVIINAAKRYRGLERGSFLNSQQLLEALKEGGRILHVA